MPHHPLTNIEIQKHEKESKFIGVYLRNKLSKIKDGAYFDKYESIGTYWIVLYINAGNLT